jgi:hypothetical protein
MEDTDKKEAYLGKLEAQLREWDAMWEVLKARLAKKRADMKVEGIELLERLEGTHAEARAKLAGLRKSAAENWETFKSQADESISFLGKAIALVQSKLKSGDADEKGGPGSE